MRDYKNAVFSDLLPDSIAQDKQAQAAAKALNPYLQEVERQSETVAIVANINKLTSLQLDHLAQEYDLSVWRGSWPVAVKRQVMRTAIAIKSRVGTVQAVKEALASIGSAATIVEWWETEPKGEPHTFTIYATQSDAEGLIDAEMQEDLRALVDDAKPLRSHYDFVMQNKCKTGVNVFACFRSVFYVRFQGGEN